MPVSHLRADIAQGRCLEYHQTLIKKQPGVYTYLILGSRRKINNNKNLPFTVKEVITDFQQVKKKLPILTKKKLSKIWKYINKGTWQKNGWFIHTNQIISIAVNSWTLNSLLHNLFSFPSKQFKVKNRKMVGNCLNMVLF